MRQLQEETILQIKEIAVGDIITYENNPRRNDKAVPPVMESIRQFGFKVPIILDRDGVIVAGHTRYKAALQLGMDKLPCIIADDLTDEQIRAFRLADNKCGEFAAWDADKLRDELQALADELDMTDFGFDLTEEMLDINEFFSPVDKPKDETSPHTVTCPFCGEEFAP